TEFALSCFGGAGGQHACRVADALGIDRVHIHPHAGVLSAYGMGLADLSVVRQRSLEMPLEEPGLERIAASLAELAESAAADLSAQGIAADDVRCSPRLRVKLKGADAALSIDWGAGDYAALVEQFHDAH